jgi:peroxiredoxin
VEFKAYVESNQPDWQAVVKATAKLDFSGGQEIFNADDLKLVVKALLPSHKMETLSFAMITDSAINVRTHTAKLTNTRFSALGQVMSGTFDVEDIFSVPVIQGPLKVKTFDVKKLAKYIKFDMPRLAEAQVLKDISLTASFRTDFATVQLDDISANVDQSRVKGFVHLATTPDTKVRYDLAINKLNLDDYRLAEDASARNETRLPEFVRTAGLEGVLDIESVVMGDKQYDNVHIATVIDNGILKADPISMVVNRGEIKAALQFDARKEPKTVLVAHLKNMDADHTINSLLQNMLGDESLILEGRVNADVDLKAAGASMAALKTSAQGKINVSMDKATVRGVDFDHASRTVVLDYAKRNDFRVSRTFKTAHDADSATTFSGLNATVKVNNGKLHNNDLSMVSDLVNVTGSGSFDFINGKLDYRPVIDMNVSNTANIRDKLRDHPMQYHAKGQSGKVTCEFDADKFDLWVGRLMIQEARAHRNRRINSQSEDSWTNVLSN